MTDPIKTDVEAGLADVKAKIAALEGDAKTEEAKASGWVATHHAIIYACLAFVAGALVGHLL